MEDAGSHWERVYREKADADLSWYQTRPQVSLGLIAATGAGRNAGIIDVGGGTSTLVDELLRLGYSDMTVLDISQEALARARRRLRGEGARVTWLCRDVTDFRPDRQWEVWHDRATFHFLTDTSQREGYRRALAAAVRRGHVIIATFALSGPPRCSGRPVMRYSPDSLNEALATRYELVESCLERHETPGGRIQDFTYCRFRVGEP